MGQVGLEEGMKRESGELVGGQGKREGESRERGRRWGWGRRGEEVVG